ncbi:MAG: hypothetical protein HY290_02615 [Planctomycetia bacterium]|nr:hypothetical protein [Planctomycetia bacterium]
MSGVLVSGACLLNAADEAPNTGLRGILPAAVPSDLGAALAVLPENWKDWSSAVSGELATLYEAEGTDVAGQRKVMETLRKRQATAKTYAADPRYRSILNALVSISGGLKRRLDIAEAALDTLEGGPALQTAKVNSARQKVVKEAQALESYLGSMRNGSGWGKYLQLNEVRTASGTDAATKSQTRLKEKNSLADANAREFLSRPQIASYEQAVDGYINALAAPAVASNNPELRAKLAELVKALEDYESTHASASAAAIRKAFDGVRGVAPDGGEKLGLALRDNYLNYNLRVVASEAYLNKFFHQSRNEAGPVRDFILGADVYGNQNTHTEVTIDLIPSGASAQFDVKASGAVASNTSGVTSQATVYTYGNHYFTALKRVVFDGEKFTSYAARIGVSANNSTTGADTNFGIFSGIANGIAVNRAEGMRGESEAIAASRIRDRVLPQFNSEVQKEFNNMNPDVAARLDALRELNLYPDAKSWSTTDTELKVSSRLMTATEVGGSEPSPSMYLGRGMTVLLHDSLINNSIDRLDFAGKTMTDAEMRAKIEAQATKLLGREVKFDEAAATNDDSGIKTIVFDKADPIRVHSDDGTLIVTMKAGFQQEGKEDIPTQIITIPITFQVTMENVILETGSVEVAAADKPESAAKQLAQAGVIKKKIATAFPRRDLKRVHRVEEKKVKAITAVTRIRALDGWLSISIE